MSATYTFDVFCSLDGYGPYGEDGDWGGYWSRQGPEFLESTALDGRIQELRYRPSVHRSTMADDAS